MPQVRLIVCEQNSDWIVALRWTLGPASRLLVETHSPEEFWQSLARYPASLLAWEVTDANIAEVCKGLTQLRHSFPLARGVVLVARANGDLVWPAREAGAVHAAVSTRGLECLASLFARHCASIPQPVHDFRQRIWSRLPWLDEDKPCP